MIKTTTKPQLSDSNTKDPKKLHIIKRIGDETSGTFSRYALCGERMSEILFEHTGSICQKCVDIQRKEQS